MCSCVQVINDTSIVKARKNYRDNCMDAIMESLPYMRRDRQAYPLTFKQWRIIAESIRDKWLIKKGQLHEVQVNKMDGRIYSFRSKIGLADLCNQFELFEEC